MSRRDFIRAAGGALAPAALPTSAVEAQGTVRELDEKGLADFLADLKGKRIIDVRFPNHRIGGDGNDWGLQCGSRKCPTLQAPFQQGFDFEYKKDLERILKIPRTTSILVVCTANILSRDAAAELKKLGFTNVSVLKGGLRSLQPGSRHLFGVIPR